MPDYAPRLTKRSELDAYAATDSLTRRGRDSRLISRTRMDYSIEELASLLGVSVELAHALEQGCIDVVRPPFDDGPLVEVPAETMNATTRNAVDGYKRFLTYAEGPLPLPKGQEPERVNVSVEVPARDARVYALRRGLNGETATFTPNTLPDPFKRVQMLQSLDVRPSELAEATNLKVATVADFLTTPNPDATTDAFKILCIALRFLASGPNLGGVRSKSEDRAAHQRMMGLRS